MEPLHSLPSGTVLKIGEALVRLTVHCEPCRRLKEVVDPKAIEHKRGYLGAFLSGGQLRVGDPVESIGVQHEPIPYDLKERLAWFLDRQSVPIEVTTLVHEVGLSLSYCRAIPNLLRGRPDLESKVTFRGRTVQKARSKRGGTARLPRQGNESIGYTDNTTNILAKSLEFISGAFVVYLHDNRSFTVPLETLPALARATVAQRSHWELAEQGLRIRWPGLELEVTILDLLGLPG
jgi:hypothetical protein